MKPAWTLVIACLAAAPLQAAEPPAPSAQAGDPASTEVLVERRNQVAASAGFGGPLGATLRLDLLRGLGADVREEQERVKAVCALPIPYCAGGFLLGVEAGSGGGKLSLGVGGLARVDADDFRGTVGAGLRVALARTWGSPVGTEPGLTYLGPELDVSILRLGIGLGVLWRVSGQGGSSAVFSWSVGLRL